jgi:putative nucleotidyltransferase with HDIG domain
MNRPEPSGWLAAFLRRQGSLPPRATGIMLATLAGTLAIVLISGQYKSLFKYVSPASYEVGSVAPRDVTVERDVLYTDLEATRLRQEAVEKLVAPIFRVNEEIGQSKLLQLDEFGQALSRLAGQGEPTGTLFLKLQLSFPGVLEQQELARLRPQAAMLLERTRQLLEQTYRIGLLRLPEPGSELLSTGAIELWRWHDGRLEKQRVLVEDPLTRQRLRDWALGNLKDLSSQQAGLVVRLLEAFAAENGFLDLGETLKAKARAVEQVEPVLAKLSRDQVIIRKGDLVTEEAAQQIRALSEYSASVSISSIAGNALYVLIVLALCPFLLGALAPGLKRSQLLFLAGITLSYLALAAVIFNLLEARGGLPLAVFLPTSALSMLVCLLASTRAAYVFSLEASLLLLPVLGLDLFSFFFALASGLAAAAVVARVERRIELLKAGGVLSLVSFLVLLSGGLLKGDFPRVLLAAPVWGLANAFLGSLLTLGLLPAFEHLLNAASRFRLIELSDLNAPIMKRMLAQAPGTYSHSISVANLAESACSAMGANALLARVGAYYHDIGKINKPKYFAENEMGSASKHKELSPAMSQLIIVGHVKDGVEMAKEFGLPNVLRQFVETHHGTTLVEPFYHEARKKYEEPMAAGKKPVESPPSESEFRYAGPKPKSKEAAIVMLADAVEGAIRSLPEVTLARVEAVVHNIAMKRLQDGQFDECDLTLRELSQIETTISKSLAAHYHGRVAYPTAPDAPARPPSKPGVPKMVET